MNLLLPHDLKQLKLMIISEPPIDYLTNYVLASFSLSDVLIEGVSSTNSFNGQCFHLVKLKGLPIDLMARLPSPYDPVFNGLVAGNYLMARGELKKPVKGNVFLSVLYSENIIGYSNL